MVYKGTILYGISTAKKRSGLIYGVNDNAKKYVNEIRQNLHHKL